MVKQLSRSTIPLTVDIKGTINPKEMGTPSTSPQRAAPIVLQPDPLTAVQVAMMMEEAYSSSERNRSIKCTLLN
jgi:hypothetical protein